MWDQVEFSDTLLALSLFFFIPGYAFISALFPGKKEISGIERFTLSVGFSLILTVFDDFLISLFPWGYRPAPIVVSIIGITAFFSIVSLLTRKLLDEDEQFSFSIKEFSTSPTGSENHLSPLRFQTFNQKVFWNRNEAKWFLDPVGEVLDYIKIQIKKLCSGEAWKLEQLI